MKPVTDKRARTLNGVEWDAIPFAELIAGQQPVVLKGAVRDWELVKAAGHSSGRVVEYLKSFYNGKTVATYLADASEKGRYAYTHDLAALNFSTKRLPLDAVLDEILTHKNDPAPPGIYVGSTTIDACLPGLRKENDLLFDDIMFAEHSPLASIWLGNASLISAHYDAPNNIACCAVGKRRFTLFPPSQIHNLYPGPLEPTPGGQAISMVDFANPDFTKHPRFKRALETALVAELEPGDALFYPSMWWHQVEALESLNVLINYWWSTSPKYMGTPMNVLMHSLLSLRDRPKEEKQAWRDVFDYYIFGDSESPVEHLPEHAWGDLGPLDDVKARKLRAYLLNRLNR